MYKLKNSQNHYSIFKKKKTFLYKFVSLDTSSDASKFKSLENESLWFDVAKNLNDPFELVNVDIDRNILKNNPNLVSTYLEIENKINSLKPYIKLTSFTTNMEKNICMWGYYTNSCKGFCLKFELINNKKPKYNISKIQYKTDIQKIDQIALIAFDRFSKILNYYFGSTLQQAILINDLISELSCYKGKSWKHEKEYRGLCLDNFGSSGINIKFKDLNLKLVGIYAGPSCSQKDYDELKRIATKIGITNFKKLKTDDKEYKVID